MSIFRKTIYTIGVKIRNPSYVRIYKELKESEYKSLESLEQIQFVKLRKLLIFSYENSEFYRANFTRINFNPYNDLSCIDDINKIQVLAKEDLINQNDKVHTVKNFQFKKLFFSETSGSSGEPLVFYKDEEWDSYNRASIQRGMSWFGIKAWDKNGYFWGYSFSRKKAFVTKIMDYLVNRFRLFQYDDKSLNDFTKKAQRATYLHGYSSMLYETAKILNEKGVKLNNIKFVKGTSEKIYEHYHAETLKAFGNKIISEYGSAETGIIAFECPHGKMHINEETCIVENIDDEIVVTNLVAYSFPIIRYKLGDSVKFSDDKCSCGRSHRVIKEVLGRVGKNILGHSQKFPSLTLYYIFKCLALEYGVNVNYKGVQRCVGELDLLLDSKISEESKDAILLLANRYFNNDISVTINDGMVIHDKEGKLKDFVSLINN